jgi:hypothetical protein
MYASIGSDWAPDSASVFFGSDRMRRGAPQLQRIRLDGGEAEALTSWRGAISDHCPLTDGRSVAVVAKDMARWVAQTTLPEDPWSATPASVTVTGARVADGRRLRFVNNWSWETAPVRLPGLLCWPMRRNRRHARPTAGGRLSLRASSRLAARKLWGRSMPSESPRCRWAWRSVSISARL